MGHTITIGGETYVVRNIRDNGWGIEGTADIECEGADFIVCLDHESAGALARARWDDMVANDPAEFAAIVGADTLAAWCLGQYAGPGSVQVKSLEAWLELVADHPNEELASYDHEEREVDSVSPSVVEDLGMVPTLAYRTN